MKRAPGRSLLTLYHRSGVTQCNGLQAGVFQFNLLVNTAITECFALPIDSPRPFEEESLPASLVGCLKCFLSVLSAPTRGNLQMN